MGIHKKYSDHEMIQLIIDEYNLTSIVPKYTTKRNIHQNTYIKRFGTWDNVLQKAGIAKHITVSVERNCPTCNETFIVLYSTHNFCSVKCSNSSRRTNFTKKRTRDEYRQDNLNILLYGEFETLSYENKRKRIIREQNECCNKCQIKEWQGSKLTLEIDHINGNNSDDRHENMEALCPNCHSLTPTFRGKNKNSIKKNSISDAEILQAVSETSSIRKALIKLGLSPKGNNYKRLYNVLNNDVECLI